MLGQAHLPHGCSKGLKALAEVPKHQSTDAISKTIDAAVEYLLLHHVHKRSHDVHRVPKPGWRKLSFPLMYQTDILTALGVRDPRMDDAVSVVLSKQAESGRWLCENSYANERILVPLEYLAQESKWLTLRALRVLRRFYG